MFRDLIKEQPGVDIYAIISLCIFVAFFCLISFMAFSHKKQKIKELSMIPFDGEINPNNTDQKDKQE